MQERTLEMFSASLARDEKSAETIFNRKKTILTEPLQEVYKNFPRQHNSLFKFLDSWHKFDKILSTEIKKHEVARDFRKKSEIDKVGVSKFIKSIIIKKLLNTDEVKPFVPKRVLDKTRIYLYNIQDAFSKLSVDITEPMPKNLKGLPIEYKKLIWAIKLLSPGKTAHEAILNHIRQLAIQSASSLHYFTDACLPKPSDEFLKSIKNTYGIKEPESKIMIEVYLYIFQYYSFQKTKNLLPPSESKEHEEEKNIRKAVLELNTRLQFPPQDDDLHLKVAFKDYSTLQSEVLALIRSTRDAANRYAKFQGFLEPYMENIIDDLDKMPKSFEKKHSAEAKAVVQKPKAS